jgi:hypothetical protein
MPTYANCIFLLWISHVSTGMSIDRDNAKEDLDDGIPIHW